MTKYFSTPCQNPSPKSGDQQDKKARGDPPYPFFRRHQTKTKKAVWGQDQDIGYFIKYYSLTGLIITKE